MLFNKGNKAGLFPLMKLYKINAEGAYVPGCDCTIYEVSENHSRAHLENKKCLNGTYSTHRSTIANSEPADYLNDIYNAEFSMFTQISYEDAIVYYEQAFEKYQRNGRDYYYAAIATSKLGDIKKANQYLRHGIKNGFFGEDLLISEPNLENFRKSDYWNGIPELIKKEKEKFLKQFNTIKDTPFTSLLPFQENEKWGYFSKVDGKILIPAKFKKTNMGKGCLEIEVVPNNVIFLYPDFSVEQYEPGERIYHHEERSNHPKVVDDLPQGGFTVEDNKIVSVSNIYDKRDYSTGKFSYKDVAYIKGPFLLDKKNHAAASKDGKWGIINEQGKNLKEFDFNYKKIRYSEEYKYKEKGDWFYFVDLEDNHGFINSKGKKRLVNEINKVKFYHTKLAGYGVLRDKNKKLGFKIIDFKNLKIIFETSEFRFANFVAQYEKCHLTFAEKEMRSNISTIYCIVKDKDGNELYLDFSGKAYKHNEN